VTLQSSLTIDLDAIAANWQALDRASVAGTETAAVLKADAYGCGASHVALRLAREGVRTFFTALPEEGKTLRRTLGDGPAIYVFAGYASGHRQCFAENALRPVLNTARQASAWLSDMPGASAALQLDTGMNRLGLEPDEFARLGPLPGCIDMVMSHLACADTPDHAQNARQLACFRELTAGLSARRSLAATGGILLGADYHFDLTRPGIGLYGGRPHAGSARVVRLDVPILQLRDVAPGETVGYGATWVADRPSRIATIAAGYADGLLRTASNRATAYHDATPLPFAGRVSMDLIGLDVTGCPEAAEGEMVEIIGPNQSIDKFADAAGTIGYEVLTSLGSRYARSYTGARSSR